MSQKKTKVSLYLLVCYMLLTKTKVEIKFWFQLQVRSVEWVLVVYSIIKLNIGIILYFGSYLGFHVRDFLTVKPPGDNSWRVRSI